MDALGLGLVGVVALILVKEAGVPVPVPGDLLVVGAGVAASQGEVDASLYTYQPVNFDAGLGWPGLARVLPGIVLAVIACLVPLGWFVLRRVRRRTANPGAG